MYTRSTNNSRTGVGSFIARLVIEVQRQLRDDNSAGVVKCKTKTKTKTKQKNKDAVKSYR